MTQTTTRNDGFCYENWERLEDGLRENFLMYGFSLDPLLFRDEVSDCIEGYELCGLVIAAGASPSEEEVSVLHAALLAAIADDDNE